MIISRWTSATTVAFTAFFFLVLVSAPSAQAADDETSITYVDLDNVAGPWDGTSWATAFATIQEGIDAAARDGEVWVAEGTYGELRQNQTGSLVMKSGVDLHGGFAGWESALEQRDAALHVTIIDGSKSHVGSNAYHVILGADDTTLSGFVIRGAMAYTPQTAAGFTSITAT